MVLLAGTTTARYEVEYRADVTQGGVRVHVLHLEPGVVDLDLWRLPSLWRSLP